MLRAVLLRLFVVYLLESFLQREFLQRGILVDDAACKVDYQFVCLEWVGVGGCSLQATVNCGN